MEIVERGPWTARQDGPKTFVESEDFTHDVRLYVDGDFSSPEQKLAYAEEIARRLNAWGPAKDGAQPESAGQEGG